MWLTFYFYGPWLVYTLCKSLLELLQVLSNPVWRPYLNFCCVGEELEARRLPACNVALNTNLTKDKCT